MSTAVKDPEQETSRLDPFTLRCDTPGHEEVTGDWETAVAGNWDIPLWAWVNAETGGVAYYPFAARDCVLIPGRDPLGLRRCPECVKANTGEPGENGEFPAYNWAACLPVRKSHMPARKLYGESLQETFAALDQTGYLRADEVEELLEAAADAAAPAEPGLTVVISHEDAAPHTFSSLDVEQATELIAVPQPPAERAADPDIIDKLFGAQAEPLWPEEKPRHTAPMEAVGGEA